MCGGIEYKGTKVYFPNPEAKLPVLTKSGDHHWLPWGWRKRTDRSFVSGGWARLESIKAMKWKAWQPKPVLIICDRYMEKDEEGNSHWFDMHDGMAIQGLIATRNDVQLVYVVTEDPPPEFAWVHDRWPRLVRLAKS